MVLEIRGTYEVMTVYYHCVLCLTRLETSAGLFFNTMYIIILVIAEREYLDWIALVSGPGAVYMHELKQYVSSLDME